MARTPSTEAVYTGDGATTIFQLNFPILDATDVFVSVNGVDVSFTFLPGTPASVQTTVPPAFGTEVIVYRNTDAVSIEHVFTAGVPFLPRYVDENNRQLLYAIQEGLQSFGETDAKAQQALDTANAANETANDALSQVQANVSRNLRVANTDPVIPPIPSVALRQGMLLGFDSAGNPITIPAGPSGSAAALAMALADQADPANGAGLIGYRGYTVHQRLDEERSLLSFGAVGDGVTDDTVAVQAAFDSGLPLWGSLADYLLTAPIIITQPTKFRGGGWSTRFIHRGDYGDTFRIADPANLAVIRGVHLSEFQISQDISVPVTTGAQLRIEACRDVWLTNVLIRNGWIGYANVGSDQVHISGLYVLFDNTNGGNVNGRRYVQVLPTANPGKAAHPGDVFITNSNFRSGSSPSCGVGFEMTAGDGIWLNNSHIGNCTQQNLRVDANNVTKCTGLMMDNVWLDIGTGESIKFQGSVPAINGNHYIKNCKLLGGGTCTHGIDIDGAASRIRIESTEISDMLNNGIWTRPTSTGEVKISECIIRDNSQAGAGVSNGFNFAGTGNTYFNNNLVAGNLYAQHVAITGAKALAVLNDNVLVGNFTGSARMSTLTGTQISQKNNHGFNPTGNESVTVGPSPWTFTNDKGWPVEIYVGGGVVSGIARQSISLFGITSGSFTLGTGERITVTYSSPPGARVFGL
ncbi:Pectate lyase superfamily protein [compost metagenome]